MTNDGDGRSPMNLERFAEVLDAYGADVAAWPEQEREGALALLAVSQQARSLREDAAAFDRLLDQAADVVPSDTLRERILLTAPGARPSLRRRAVSWLSEVWPYSPSWQPIAALGAAAVLGVTVGLLQGDTTQEPVSVDLSEVAFTSYVELGDEP